MDTRTAIPAGFYLHCKGPTAWVAGGFCCLLRLPHRQPQVAPARSDGLREQESKGMPGSIDLVALAELVLLRTFV